MSSKELIAEAREFLAGSGKATLLGRVTDALEAAESLNQRWIDVALEVDAETPDELEDEFRTILNAINVPGFGLWGLYALEALLSSIEVTMGETWVEDIEPRIKQWKASAAEVSRLRAQVSGLESIQRKSWA